MVFGEEQGVQVMQGMIDIAQDVDDTHLDTLKDQDPINIITEYPWCITRDRKDLNRHIPKIQLTFYQQNLSAILQSLGYWGNHAIDAAREILEQAGGEDVSLPDRILGVGQALEEIFTQQQRDPYENLYRADKIIKITFPYYSTYHHILSNSWGENKGILGDLVEKTLVRVSKQLMPSAGILSPKAWEGLQVNSIPVNFVLLNTAEDSNIKANKRLIQNLLLLNAPVRVNFIAALPPAICTAWIPGVRWMPAAYISQLTVENVGQVSYMGDDLGNVPEAYRVDFVLTELFETSRQIILDEKSRKIKAISVDDINLFEKGQTGEPPERA